MKFLQYGPQTKPILIGMGIVVALMITAAALFGCKQASAADISMCGPIPQVAQRLQDEFGEIGLIAFPYQDVLRLIFGNPETFTWTMVAMTPDGHACTMYDGVDLILPSAAPEEDPA